MQMIRLDINTRKRVIILRRAGYSSSEIHRRLKEEDIFVTIHCINRLLRKFRHHGSILDLPRRKIQKKITDEMSKLIDKLMEADDELTASELKSQLVQKYPALDVSLNTIKRARRKNGWVNTRPHYCQLIGDVNKVKRKEWCEQQLANKEDFRDVIFCDECTVQLEHHG